LQAETVITAPAVDVDCDGDTLMAEADTEEVEDSYVKADAMDADGDAIHSGDSVVMAETDADGDVIMMTVEAEAEVDEDVVMGQAPGIEEVVVPSSVPARLLVGITACGYNHRAVAYPWRRVPRRPYSLLRSG
jgi:hypothetical protein